MCSLLELVERCMVGQRGGKKTKTKLSKKSDALSSGPPAAASGRSCLCSLLLSLWMREGVSA
jgi:hypothetical protein